MKMNFPAVAVRPFEEESVLRSIEIPFNDPVKDSPSRPPRTHSRSSQLSTSSERGRRQSPLFIRTCPSRSTSSSPSRSRRRTRHKSVREKFLEEGKLSHDEIELNTKPFTRRSSVETAIHVPVTQESDAADMKKLAKSDLHQTEHKIKPFILFVNPGKMRIILLPLYIVFGGLVFKILSILACPSYVDLYKSSIRFNETQDLQDENLLISLWNLTLSLNILHDRPWKSTAKAAILKHRIKVTQNLLDYESEKPDLSILPLSVSVLYSYSLASMIGYSDECLNTHVIQTVSWQIFSILYTLFGIPIFLLTLISSINFLKVILNFIIDTMSQKTQNIFVYVVILVYYPIIGFVIFSSTGSQKPFLDLFNSLILIGPLSCTHHSKVSHQMTIFDDFLIIMKIVYLFAGHGGLLLILRDQIFQSIMETASTGVNQQRSQTNQQQIELNNVQKLFMWISPTRCT